MLHQCPESVITVVTIDHVLLLRSSIKFQVLPSNQYRVYWVRALLDSSAFEMSTKLSSVILTELARVSVAAGPEPRQHPHRDLPGAESLADEDDGSAFAIRCHFLPLFLPRTTRDRESRADASGIVTLSCAPLRYICIVGREEKLPRMCASLPALDPATGCGLVEEVPPLDRL